MCLDTHLWSVFGCLVVSHSVCSDVLSGIPRKYRHRGIDPRDPEVLVVLKKVERFDTPGWRRWQSKGTGRHREGFWRLRIVLTCKGFDIWVRKLLRITVKSVVSDTSLNTDSSSVLFQPDSSYSFERVRREDNRPNRSLNHFRNFEHNFYWRKRSDRRVPSR